MWIFKEWGNLSELETYLEILDHDFSKLCLTETWLNDSNSNIHAINDYSIVGNIEPGWWRSGITHKRRLNFF